MNRLDHLGKVDNPTFYCYKLLFQESNLVFRIRITLLVIVKYAVSGNDSVNS